MENEVEGLYQSLEAETLKRREAEASLVNTMLLGNRSLSSPAGRGFAHSFVTCSAGGSGPAPAEESTKSKRASFGGFQVPTIQVPGSEPLSSSPSFAGGELLPVTYRLATRSPYSPGRLLSSSFQAESELEATYIADQEAARAAVRAARLASMATALDHQITTSPSARLASPSTRLASPSARLASPSARLASPSARLAPTSPWAGESASYQIMRDIQAIRATATANSLASPRNSISSPRLAPPRTLSPGQHPSSYLSHTRSLSPRGAASTNRDLYRPLSPRPVSPMSSTRSPYASHLTSSRDPTLPGSQHDSYLTTRTLSPRLSHSQSLLLPTSPQASPRAHTPSDHYLRTSRELSIGTARAAIQGILAGSTLSPTTSGVVSSPRAISPRGHSSYTSTVGTAPGLSPTASGVVSSPRAISPRGYSSYTSTVGTAPGLATTGGSSAAVAAIRHRLEARGKLRTSGGSFNHGGGLGTVGSTSGGSFSHGRGLGAVGSPNSVATSASISGLRDRLSSQIGAVLHRLEPSLSGTPR
eukprot:gene16830-23110_t